MKISTKGQYALEALVDMHLNSPNAYESLHTLAQRRHLSESYLEQLFSRLRKAGLVESLRGAQGGYRLARPAEAISSGEVLRAVEGTLSPVRCICDASAACRREGVCSTRGFWTRMMDEINETVDGVSLKDLVEETRNRVMEYYI